MAGSMVSFGDFSGYLAPAASGSGPGVIVIQEWWGLVDHIKAVADRFAAAGYTALAPDLYQGESASNPDDAGKLMMALNIDKTDVALQGAIDLLLGHDAVSSGTVGTVGYCMGGQLSVLAACTGGAKVGACVNYYGIHPAVTPNYANLAAPVMGFFAEKDGFVNTEAVTGLMGAMEAAGKRLEVHRYLGVDHAFFNDTRPDVYDEAVATDTWNKTLAFFSQHLAG